MSYPFNIYTQYILDMTGKDKQLLIFASRILRCRDDLHLYRLVNSITEGELQPADKLALSEIGFPTDYLFYKQDIFAYLNREAPKYIRKYRKKEPQNTSRIPEEPEIV